MTASLATLELVGEPGNQLQGFVPADVNRHFAIRRFAVKFVVVRPMVRWMPVRGMSSSMARCFFRTVMVACIHSYQISLWRSWFARCLQAHKELVP